ncbi:unnamed protein product [Polarella glacialis]|uniref:Uncharacterized protein n=1 Tax=Polarella glacialis TaxID=89957 RepID=A0A813EY34_POLGL|nr:unnamed protein product [Polarella glacialis]
MEDGLREQGFMALQCQDNLSDVWVWTRGLPSFTVKLWLIALWVGFLLLATKCADFVASRLGLLDIAWLRAPAWRLPVLLLWRFVHGHLPSMPYDLNEALVGFACSSFCIGSFGESVSNYLYLHLAVTWPAASNWDRTTRNWIFLVACMGSALIGIFLKGVTADRRGEGMCSHSGPEYYVWLTSLLTTAGLCVASAWAPAGHGKVIPT